MNALSEEQKEELKAIKEHFSNLVMNTVNNPFDLEKIYPDTNNIEVLSEQLTDLKKCLDSFRPLSSEQVAHLNEVFNDLLKIQDFLTMLNFPIFHSKLIVIS